MVRGLTVVAPLSPSFLCKVFIIEMLGPDFVFRVCQSRGFFFCGGGVVATFFHYRFCQARTRIDRQCKKQVLRLRRRVTTKKQTKAEAKSCAFAEGS